MSYPSQSPPPRRPPGTRWAPEPGIRRRLGRRLALALVVLLPTCFAGWLVWQSVGGPTAADRPAPTLMPFPGSVANSPSGKGRSHGKKDGPREMPDGKPLAGKTVVLDPGHNPHNRDHPGKINRKVGIGTARKECDTTGASTESGYPEAEFALDLARRVRAELTKRGATVKLTHDGRRAWGPCVDDRAGAGNRAEADAAVSLHADGAPVGNRGFHVILPASVHKGHADTGAITGPSRRLGRELLAAFRHSTGERPANYVGDGTGLKTRADLGGLNLSRVPKVFLECGNMRDPQDADRLTDPEWRERAARGVAAGIGSYLTEKR